MTPAPTTSAATAASPAPASVSSPTHKRQWDILPAVRLQSALQARELLQKAPRGLYFLGNILQLLANPLTKPADAAAAATGAASSSGAITARGAFVPGAAPHYSSSATAVLSAIPLSGVTACLTAITDALAALPEHLLFSSRPMLWVPVTQSTASASASPSAGAAGAGVGGAVPTQPFALPGLLADQLRCLSSRGFCMAAAAKCCRMNRALLKNNPRLQLADEDDPERDSYDHSSHEVLEDGAGGSGSRAGRFLASLTGGAAGGAGGSSSSSSGGTALAAAPSMAGSLLRSMWEGSKLAASLFKRKGESAAAAGSSSGGSGVYTGGSTSAAAVLGASPTTSGDTSSSSSSSSGKRASKVADDSAIILAAAPAEDAAALSSAPFAEKPLLAFCRLFAFLLLPRASMTAAGIMLLPSSGDARGGGAAEGGHGSSSGGGSSGGTSIFSRVYALNNLAFSESLQLLRNLWFYFAETQDVKSFLQERGYASTAVSDGAFAVLAVVTVLLGHVLPVLDSFELYNNNTSSGAVSGSGSDSSGAGVALPLREMRHLLRLLRDLLAHADGIGVDSFTTPAAEAALDAPGTIFWPRLAAAAVQVLRRAYDRHSQKPMGPSDMWTIDVSKLQLCISLATGSALGVTGSAPRKKLSRKEAEAAAKKKLLRTLPFAVPFLTRAEQFHTVRAERLQLCQQGQAQVKLTVHRAHLFENCYSSLRDLPGSDWSRKFYVTFFSLQGHEEKGLDAGGLFKELWVSLSDILFSPAYGMWNCTEAGDLYPNPSSALLTGMPDDALFQFVGRVVGKALFEGITIGPRFAKFFLQ